MRFTRIFGIIRTVGTGGKRNFCRGGKSSPEGESAKTITVPLANDRWFEGVEAFNVDLTGPTGGAALGATSRSKVRIESDDVKLPGTFVFAAPTYSVSEGTPTVTLTVKRVGGDDVAADVRLYTTGAGTGAVGSAWAGADYGSVPADLHFARGETEKTIVVSVTDDTQTEGDEAFSVKLFSPSNDAAVGDPATAVVTIHDNDSTFYFSSPTGGSSYAVD